MFWNISVSVGDVGAERNVQAGANSDPRSEIRENAYCWLGNKIFYEKDRPKSKILIIFFYNVLTTIICCKEVTAIYCNH